MNPLNPKFFKTPKVLKNHSAIDHSANLKEIGVPSETKIKKKRKKFLFKFQLKEKVLRSPSNERENSPGEVYINTFDKTSLNDSKTKEVITAPKCVHKTPPMSTTKTNDSKGIKSSLPLSTLIDKENEKNKSGLITKCKVKAKWPQAKVPFRRKIQVPKYPLIKIDLNSIPSFRETENKTKNISEMENINNFFFSTDKYLNSVEAFFQTVKETQAEELSKSYAKCPERLKNAILSTSSSNSEQFINLVKDVIKAYKTRLERTKTLMMNLKNQENFNGQSLEERNSNLTNKINLFKLIKSKNEKPGMASMRSAQKERVFKCLLGKAGTRLEKTRKMSCQDERNACEACVNLAIGRMFGRVREKEKRANVKRICRERKRRVLNRISGKVMYALRQVSRRRVWEEFSNEAFIEERNEEEDIWPEERKDEGNSPIAEEDVFGTLRKAIRALRPSCSPKTKKVSRS